MIMNPFLSVFLNQMTAYRYNVVEYYPHVFKGIRQQIGLSEAEIFKALNPLENIEGLESMPKTKGGSSGAFLYTTHDAKFVLKTISTQEKLTFLNKMLDDYAERILSNDSALVRILGVFQVQCVGNYCTNLILMENASTPRRVIAKYDIKGSRYGRCTKTPHILGKDCNFIEDVGKLLLTEQDSFRLLNRLKQDTRMLAKRNLMDYSLLVTICEGDAGLRDHTNYLYRSKNSRNVYLIALIDFFQEFSFKRKGELCLKRTFLRVRTSENSVVDAIFYRRRMMKFVKRIVNYPM
mmetsp:Transcript_13117/g.24555  ORF Transcript_13117/g.24555 Transcript_13117/m.24555 type:complete len:293 (-) Transcript_13117:12-890(-)